MRRAFSIIELLVALVLLAVGIAAYARAALAIARMETASRLDAQRAELLTAHLDTLGASICDGPRVGAVRTTELNASWTAEPRDAHWEFALRIAPSPHVGRADSWQINVPCPP